jgi:uncharacterized membrane protein
MPPFQFNDEHAHFVRSYEISRGSFIGSADPLIPAGILDGLVRFPEGYKAHAAPMPSVKELFAKTAADATPLLPVTAISGLRFLEHGVVSSQVYWSGCYIPASVAIAVVRLFRLPLVTMLYAARLMNLFVFLVALSLTLRFAPDFRALIIGIAFMPMTLEQAVAVSADSVTIACAFLGFAMIIYTREQAVTRRFLRVLVLFVAFWVMCKNSLWALPLLVLVPGSQFGSRRSRVAWLAGCIVLTGSALLMWRGLVSAAESRYVAMELSKGLDLYANAAQFAAQPFRILHDLVILPDLRTNSLLMTLRFVGGFGWEMHYLPFAGRYFGVLVAVACVERSRRAFSMSERTILLVVFAVALIQTYAMLFVIDGSFAGGHYVFRFTGVQGRYLIPFCLAGFLPLRQKWISLSSKQLAPFVLAGGTLYGGLSMALIASYFYR